MASPSQTFNEFRWMDIFFFNRFIFPYTNEIERGRIRLNAILIGILECIFYSVVPFLSISIKILTRDSLSKSLKKRIYWRRMENLKVANSLAFVFSPFFVRSFFTWCYLLSTVEHKVAMCFLKVAFIVSSLRLWIVSAHFAIFRSTFLCIYGMLEALFLELLLLLSL